MEEIDFSTIEQVPEAMRKEFPKFCKSIKICKESDIWCGSVSLRGASIGVTCAPGTKATEAKATIKDSAFRRAAEYAVSINSPTICELIIQEKK